MEKPYDTTCNNIEFLNRFSDEFYKEPHRGYGGSVSAVFEALRKEDLDDVFEPAKRQFDGQGSFGNGGAMRISPAALFYLKEGFDKLKV